MSEPEPTPSPQPAPEPAAGSGAAAPPPHASPHSAGEALLLLLVSAVLAWLATRLPAQRGTLLGDLSPALFVLAWIGPAYALASRRGRDPFLVHGVLAPPAGPEGPSRGWRLAGASLVSLVILALFVGGFGLYQGRPPSDPVPWREVGELFLHHLVFIALAEEYFFRGVLQPALDPPGGPRRRLLGAPFGRGAVLGALLFGLTHVVFFADLTRLEVALPGLWFAWLRARTGSILPAVIFHAAANAVQLACFEAWGLR